MYVSEFNDESDHYCSTDSRSKAVVQEGLEGFKTTNNVMLSMYSRVNKSIYICSCVWMS